MVQIYNFFAISSQPTLKKPQSLTFYDACVKNLFYRRHIFLLTIQDSPP